MNALDNRSQGSGTSYSSRVIVCSIAWGSPLWPPSRNYPGVHSGVYSGGLLWVSTLGLGLPILDLTAHLRVPLGVYSASQLWGTTVGVYAG